MTSFESFVEVMRYLKRNNVRVTIQTTEFEHYIWVFNFAVHKDFRNRGIGSQVILDLQKFGKEIRLEANSPCDEQKSLERFYLRLGFTKFSDKIFYWTPPK